MTLRWINYAYVAGTIRYVSNRQNSILIECGRCLIPISCQKNKFYINQRLIIQGILKKNMTIKAISMQHAKGNIKPINLLVFTGRIGPGKNNPMLVRIKEGFINPELIASEPIRDPHKMDLNKRRRIIACFTGSGKLDILKAREE